ncbi:MAG: M23 family metallopeptidase [Solirubrobacteraceae bacterium]
MRFVGPVASVVAAVVVAAVIAPGASAESARASAGARAAGEVASAAMLHSGGAAYYGPARSGGSAYGAPLHPVDARPVATYLQIAPRTLRPGQLPNVRFRVRQRGVSTVNARVMVLTTGRDARPDPVLDVRLGRVAVGHTITVRWPKKAALAAGRYRVSLHATDPAGRTLARRDHPGQALLRVVKPPPAPKPKPAPAPAPTAKPTPAPAPTPPPAPAPPVLGADGVFPVAGPHSFGGEDARFGAGRPGHTHEGQDVTAAAGTLVVAPTAGTVTAVDYQARGAGYYVVMRSVDGRDFFLCHFQKGTTAVSVGQTVAAGTPIARVGATGSATGPHLHFEIWDGPWRQGGHPIDPLAQLRAWDAG